MASTTADLPISPGGTKSKTGSDALEAEAIGLEVAVRIHGSQVAAVVLEATEHVEPFEEDTTTMIVFPRGAVVKLRARVRTGHALVLTNLATKQTALCRIIQVNTAPNVAHYVKLEFIQPTPGFWGVHFPSEPLRPERPQEAPASVSAPAPPGKSENFVETSAPVKTVQTPQTAPRSGMPIAPAAAKPPIREVVKPAPAKSSSPLAPPTQYGSGQHGQKEEIVPLASSPAADRWAASQNRTPAAAPPSLPKPESRPAAIIEEPIFDSLTTQEEIFSREPSSGVANEKYGQKATSDIDPVASRTRIGTIDYSSLLQPAATATPKHRSTPVTFAAAAVVILAFVAAGAMYMRRNPSRTTHTTQTASTAPSSQAAPSQPLSSQPASQSATTAQNPGLTSSSTITPPAPEQSETNPAAPTAVLAPQQNLLPAAPAHSSQKNAAPASHPTISTGMASVYAGDLKARPQIKPRAAAHMAASMPDINARASREIPGASAGNALGSLVSGADGPNLLAPEPEKPAPAQGGNVRLPKLISSVAPIYPQLAAANHVEGDVKIQAEIDASGKVISARVISGPILLRSAAMNAVRRWKYSPAMLDGKAIATQYVVMVRFRLNP